MITLKKVIGISIITLLFLGLFIYGVYDSGLMVVLKAVGITLGIIIIVCIGGYLIAYDD